MVLIIIRDCFHRHPTISVTTVFSKGEPLGRNKTNGGDLDILSRTKTKEISI